jgi:hypothetical protein
MLPGLENPFLDQAGGAQEAEHAGRFLRRGGFQRIQGDFFHDAAVEGALPPGVVRDFSGNQGVPLLPELEHAAVAPGEVAFPVGPPEQDETQQ